MIELTLYVGPGEEENLSGFDLIGHADSAPYGEDLVCCAVSTLATATVNAITKVAELSEETELEVGEGKIFLHLQGFPQAEQKKLFDFSLRAFQYNMECLADQYPEYVHVTKRKDGSNEI